MKKIFMTSVFALFAVSAFAADPIIDEVPVPVEKPLELKQNYVGVNFSQRVSGDSHSSVGFIAGRELHPNVTVEGSYERSFNNNRKDGVTDLVSGNVLIGQHMGIVSPYAIGGLGYEWRDNASDRVVGIAGVGSKLHITESLDFDLRYRYINAFDNSKRSDEHVITSGFNVRF